MSKAAPCNKHNSSNSSNTGTGVNSSCAEHCSSGFSDSDGNSSSSSNDSNSSSSSNSTIKADQGKKKSRKHQPRTAAAETYPPTLQGYAALLDAEEPIIKHHSRRKYQQERKKKEQVATDSCKQLDQARTAAEADTDSEIETDSETKTVATTTTSTSSTASRRLFPASSSAAVPPQPPPPPTVEGAEGKKRRKFKDRNSNRKHRQQHKRKHLTAEQRQQRQMAKQERRAMVFRRAREERGEPFMLYIQMQFCPHGNLKDWLNRPERTIDPLQVLKLFAQMCNGLEHVHAMGLIHRDLKPENVFLLSPNHLRIGDFGLSTQATVGAARGRTSSAVRVSKQLKELNTCDPRWSHTSRIGTPLYCSPEQLSGSFYSQKSDVFSLGVIFCEMHCPTGITDMERITTLARCRNGLIDLHEPPEDRNSTDDSQGPTNLDNPDLHHTDSPDNGLTDLHDSSDEFGTTTNSEHLPSADLASNTPPSRRSNSERKSRGGSKVFMSPLARSFVLRLLAKNPNDRPSAEEILNHPYYITTVMANLSNRREDFSSVWSDLEASLSRSGSPVPLSPRGELFSSSQLRPSSPFHSPSSRAAPASAAASTRSFTTPRNAVKIRSAPKSFDARYRRRSSTSSDNSPHSPPTPSASLLNTSTQGSAVSRPSPIRQTTATGFGASSRSRVSDSSVVGSE
mmetsp:Transcript_33610/g.66118  ORF Transcript_33610/g.66118 Transcript_33610/m.66118 type:complete len:681 (+) Transcript_33610:508-2550(+)